MNLLMSTTLGAVIGGLLGFLLRPSAPFIGPLPFETVITRGANLTGLDILLRGTAETSFNYMCVGLLIGGIVGWVIKRQSSKGTSR